jgi:hypothetical protein
MLQGQYLTSLCVQPAYKQTTYSQCAIQSHTVNVTVFPFQNKVSLHFSDDTQAQNCTNLRRAPVTDFPSRLGAFLVTKTAVSYSVLLPYKVQADIRVYPITRFQTWQSATYPWWSPVASLDVDPDDSRLKCSLLKTDTRLRRDPVANRPSGWPGGGGG